MYNNMLVTHRYATMVTILFVTIALLYLNATPSFESPDESAHFLYTHTWIETGELPVMKSYQEMWQSGQLAGHHPPLYYALLSLILRLTERNDLTDYFINNPFASIGTVTLNNQNVFLHMMTHTGDTGIAITLGRLVSITLGVATLWFLYGSAYLITTDPTFSACVMLLTSSIPTFIFISAAINNDNLATALFSAGILWLVRVVQQRTLTTSSAVLIGVILGGLALTKLNTIMMFGLVGGTLFIGLLFKRFTLRSVVMTLLLAGGISMALAGWWYVRNWQLYGDPLALAATQRIWGRGQPPTEWSAILFEAKGVWESFWLVLGWFNIRGNDWFYSYVAVVVGFGGLGVLVQTYRDRLFRQYVALFGAIILLLVIGLAITTRQINVSQGRILFPGLAAVTILLVSGWRTLLGRRWYWLPIIPFFAISVATPFIYIEPAFRFPQPVMSLPENATPVIARADGLELLGYRFTPRISQQGPITVDLYIRGANPANPTLFIKLIDPVTQVPIGGVDLYPGMTYTNQFDPMTIYQVSATFIVDDARITDYFSRRLNLIFGWRYYDVDHPENANLLVWQDANGTPLTTLMLPGPVYIQPDYVPPEAKISTTIRFGNAIQLTGYSVTPIQHELHIATNWLSTNRPDQDWVISIGLLNGQNELVAQADGDPAYFPTRYWETGLAHRDERTIVLPDELPAGSYRLYITLYNRESNANLPVFGADVEPGATRFFLPEPIIIDG